MNNIEFLNYTPTPTEKHLGVATVRYDRKFILRYKIAPNPKGENLFVNAPSLKVDDSDKPYKPAFEIDSKYESEELEKFILQNVRLHMPPKKQSAPEQYNFITGEGTPF